MFEISCLELLIFIAIIWIIVRSCVILNQRSFSIKRECQLLLVLFCLMVVARIVYFPWHTLDGHVEPMHFDSSKMFPIWFNVVPVVHLFETYDGWKLNVFGNIGLFIPIGLVWPLCFKKLDTFWKAILAGVGLTLFIEITQLPFYERCSDIDDILLNSLGAIIGAGIFFIFKKIFCKNNKQA